MPPSACFRDAPGPLACLRPLARLAASPPPTPASFFSLLTVCVLLQDGTVVRFQVRQGGGESIQQVEQFVSCQAVNDVSAGYMYRGMRHQVPRRRPRSPRAGFCLISCSFHSSAHTTCLQRPSCSGLMVREPKASGPGRPVPRLSPRLLFRALRSRSPPAPWVGVNWAGAVGSGSTRHRPPHQRACRVTPVSDACFRRSRPRALLGVTRARLGPLSAVAARAAGRQESAHLASARANRIRYGFSQMDAGAPESAGWSRSRPRTALAVLSAMPVLKGMP